MTNVVLATEVIYPREPCFELAEVNEMLPIPGHGLRRMQRVRVVRGDKLWDWQRDMGPASAFKTEEFIFAGAVKVAEGRYNVLETVERLQDAADSYRAKYDRPEPRKHPPMDFVAGLEETATRRREARTGRRQISMRGQR